MKQLTFTLCALLVGTLGVISSWDYPTGVIFLLLLAGLATYKHLRFSSHTNKIAAFRPLWHIVAIIPVSLLIYAPFYTSFSRKGMGVGRVGVSTTALSDFVTIFGFFLFLILSYLVVRLYQSVRIRTFWLLLSGGIFAAWGLYTLLFLLAHINYTTLLFLFAMILLSVYSSFAGRSIPRDLHNRLPAQTYIWCCLIYACLIIAGCELIFVKDFLQGGEYKRMNTVFKFYIPAWFLFAFVAAYALFYLYNQWARHRKAIIWSPSARVTRWHLVWGWVIVAGLLFLMAAVFPVVAPHARRYHDFYNRRHLPPTLDGLAFLEATNPDEARAIRWLNVQVPGTPVILEALGADYLYEYARISANTGLPTVLGWPSHADQREHWDQTHQRKLDIQEMYTSQDMTRVRQLLQKYRVKYIYVGKTERQDYPAEGLQKFQDAPEYFDIVFQSGNTVIYRVRLKTSRS